MATRHAYTLSQTDTAVRIDAATASHVRAVKAACRLQLTDAISDTVHRQVNANTTTAAYDFFSDE